jgi:hypothetical protein
MLSDSEKKSKIYYNIWCCAFQRRYLYRGTPREYREHETIRMCLGMKNLTFAKFDSEKKKYL